MPPVGVILIYGSDETGHLLVLSQAVLSFQLPIATVPLGLFAAMPAKMGLLVAPRWLTVLCGLIAPAITV